MTDIEKLRDDVIKAARVVDNANTPSSREYLREKLDALDASMRPDPWALLEEYMENEIGDGEWEAKVDDALVWRQENPDA